MITFTRVDYPEVIAALDDLVHEIDSRVDSITLGDPSPSQDNVGYLSEASTYVASAAWLLRTYLRRRDNPMKEDSE